MKSPHYIGNEAIRKRKRRERAAEPKPRTGWTIAEWRAMAEPDPIAEPSKHATWTHWQNYKEQPVTFEPNPDAVKMWSSRGKAAPPSVVRVLNHYAKTIAKIRRLEDIPDAARSKLRDLARRDANDALEPLRADWKRTKEAVEDLTGRAMQPKPLDAAGEQRITRAWSRIERILDKAPDSERLSLIEQQLARAKASGDETTLRAMWENVPAYVEADERDDRGREEASRLRDVLVQIAAPPEAAKAYEERKAFDKGAYRVDLAFSQAEFALTGDAELDASTGEAQFPGWGENELYGLTPPTPDEVREDTESGLRALLR